MTCPQCKNQLPEDALFCNVCGSEMANIAEPEIERSQKIEQGTSCPHCGAELPPGIQACFRCGKPLAAPMALYESAPQVSANSSITFPSSSGQPPSTSKGKPIGIISAVVSAVLLLGGTIGGHFLGLYTLPLLPERAETGSLADMPSLQVSPQPSELSITETPPADIERNTETPVLPPILSEPDPEQQLESDTDIADIAPEPDSSDNRFYADRQPEYGDLMFIFVGFNGETMAERAVSGFALYFADDVSYAPETPWVGNVILYIDGEAHPIDNITFGSRNFVEVSEPGQSFTYLEVNFVDANGNALVFNKKPASYMVELSINGQKVRSYLSYMDKDGNIETWDEAYYTVPKINFFD